MSRLLAFVAVLAIVTIAAVQANEQLPAANGQKHANSAAPRAAYSHRAATWASVPILCVSSIFDSSSLRLLRPVVCRSEVGSREQRMSEAIDR